MTEHVAPRVNAARLADYIGRPVRLVCKVLKAQGDTAIAQASDGGEVQIRLTKEAEMSTPYIEVIGTVVDPTTVKTMMCINLGDEIDMNLVNDVVELYHDPRFAKMV